MILIHQPRTIPRYISGKKSLRRRPDEFCFWFLAFLSQLRGAPGTRVLQTVFSEASFLTCTLFLRRAATSRAHDGYRAGSRDAPGEDGHAARRSVKSGQGPSRLLRPGEGKEMRLSAKASEAAAHNKPDHEFDSIMMMRTASW